MSGLLTEYVGGVLGLVSLLFLISKSYYLPLKGRAYANLPQKGSLIIYPKVSLSLIVYPNEVSNINNTFSVVPQR